MKLRRYCVTVMDNWTPVRLFWTRDGALQYRDDIGYYAYAYRWHPKIGWVEMSRGPATNTPHRAA